MVIAVLFVVLILVIANIAVTLEIARADMYTRSQKLVQSAAVWLLPIVGAVVIYGVLRSNREHSESRSHHVPETSTEGEYVGQSHNAAHDP
jgi:ABC-type nickel/cobalt efflux system permease component RcnA